MSDINIGAITEALNDKTDRDMRNVDTVIGADAVIEYQRPTSTNSYIWYRKYASGWVEQGGMVLSGTTSITFPITMADTNYYINGMLSEECNGETLHIVTKDYTTTGCSFREGQYATTSRALTASARWEVKGMAAN